MKYIFITCFLFISTLNVIGQSLPIKEWPGKSDEKPCVFYISGDGAFNNFSTNLCATLNSYGFDVTGLNARSYFWKKKTPKQAGADIQALLIKKIQQRKNQNIILVGYSFGADVMPFVYTNLSPAIQAKVKKIFMLSPTNSTDMEIYLTDMIGEGKQRSMSVVNELNKITATPVHFIVPEKSGFNFSGLKHNAAKSTIKGDHNFSDYKTVSQIINKNW